MVKVLKTSLLSGVRDSNGYKIRFLFLNQSRENLVYGYSYSLFIFPTELFFSFRHVKNNFFFFFLIKARENKRRSVYYHKLYGAVNMVLVV